MSLKAGKKDIARLAAVLDQEYESVEDAAAAVMAEAWNIYEDKAKWTVVGQLAYGKGSVDPESYAASKIALGRYGTEGQARTAAQSLTYSSATREEFRAWVLPVWHGTPATFFTERKKANERLDQGLTASDKLVHESRWRQENPGVDREHYPGPPRPEPRSNCPICKQPSEEDE